MSKTHTDEAETYIPSKSEMSMMHDSLDSRGHASGSMRRKLKSAARDHSLSLFNYRDSCEFVPTHDENNDDFSVVVIENDGQYQVEVFNDGFVVKISGISENPFTIVSAFENALDYVQRELRRREDMRSIVDGIEVIENVGDVQSKMVGGFCEVSIHIDNLTKENVDGIMNTESLFVEKIDEGCNSTTISGRIEI
jgi:hypothetical protein